MTIVHLGNNNYIGLVSDTKPTNVPTGAFFYETDSGILYFYNGSSWVGFGQGRQNYSYAVYPLGATDFRVKRGSDGAVVYTSNNGGTADARGALEYCRDQLGNTSPGGLVDLSNGYFPVSSPGFILNGSNIKYQRYRGIGDGNLFGPLTEIRTKGDYPAITLDGSTGSVLGVGLEGLHISHDENTYTTGLVKILDACIENTFEKLSFFDGAGNVGNCFNFEILTTNASKAQYENKILNCNMRGFDNFININNQAAYGANISFMATLDVSHCNAWNAKRILKLGGVSGAQVLDHHFDRVNFQYSSGNTVGAGGAIFDYDSSVSCFDHKHSNCMVWDITAPGINYANVGTGVELALNECNPAWRIGGSGAYLNKVKATEYYMGGPGPMNTGWISCTSTTPTGEGVLHAATTNAPSTPSVSQDSISPYAVWASGTTQGTNTGPRRGPSTFRTSHRPLLEIYASPSNTSISRCYYGIGTNVTLGDTDTILGTTDSGIFAGWRPADTNIQIFHHDGDGTAMTVIDTGLAKTTSLWKCAFDISTSSFQWLVATPNGSKVSAPVSTHVPASSTNMAISAQAQNTTTTSINNQVRYVKLVLRNI